MAEILPIRRRKLYNQSINQLKSSNSKDSPHLRCDIQLSTTDILTRIVTEVYNIKYLCAYAHVYISQASSNLIIFIILQLIVYPKDIPNLTKI